jgi:protein CsiD
MVLLNNAFWMHGRAAFEPNVNLHRELMRIRGVFAQQ